MGILERLLGTTPPGLETRHDGLEDHLEAVIWAQEHGYGGDPETIPAVYAAIDLLAASTARLDWDAPNPSPLARRPDPFASRGDFLYETVHSLAAQGNAYWRHTPTERGVQSLEVLDPELVEVRIPDGRRRRVYRYDGSPISASLLTHLRFSPRPGEPYGIGPLQAARITFEGTASGAEWASTLFSDGGVPSGTLTVPYELTKTEAGQLKDQWTEAHGKTRSPAVLSGGASYEAIGLSPADLAYLDYIDAGARDVARIFHIPGSMLEVGTDGASLTYSNLAEEGADFVRWALAPYLRIVADAWESIPGEVRLTLDPEPLYMPSAEARSRTLQTLTGAGASFSSAASFAGVPVTAAPKPAAPAAQAEPEPDDEEVSSNA